MEPRILDESDKGYLEWTIKSLQFWGEDPFGQWTVIVKDEVFINITKGLDYFLLFGNLTKRKMGLVHSYGMDHKHIQKLMIIRSI